MPRLFIVEGPDCSGKSTLAAQMCRCLPAVYLHATGAKSLHAAMLDYHLSLIQVAKRNMELEMNVVMDRHWPSEYCYGQVLRPHVSDRVYDFEKVVSIIQELDPVYVFCGDAEMSLRHEQQKNSDHPYDLTQYAAVGFMYQELEEEMTGKDSLPLFHPKREPYLFQVRHYSVLEHGNDPVKFISTL